MDFFFFLDRESRCGERKGETLICYSTYLCFHWFFLFKKNYFRFYLLLVEEKGGRKRSRETLMCESYIQLVASHKPPVWGTWPATQACALTGNWTSNILVHRPALDPLCHTAVADEGFLMLILRKYWSKNSSDHL